MVAINSLNHPDLDQEQLRNFTRLYKTSAIFHLFNAHRIVIEEIFEEFKDSVSTESRQKILTVIRNLDDAIAASVKLRKSLFADIKYYSECEKRKRLEARERKKQAAKEAEAKSDNKTKNS